MSELNGKGPNNEGSKSGRGLGNCVEKTDKQPTEFLVGKGMGKRRNAGILNINKNETDENCSTNKRRQPN